MWHLVATILMIFLKINCPDFGRLVWRRYTKFHIGMAAAIPAIPFPAPLSLPVRVPDRWASQLVSCLLTVSFVGIIIQFTFCYLERITLTHQSPIAVYRVAQNKWEPGYLAYDSLIVDLTHLHFTYSWWIHLLTCSNLIQLFRLLLERF